MNKKRKKKKYGNNKLSKEEYNINKATVELNVVFIYTTRS